MKTKPVYQAALNISKATQISYKKVLGDMRSYKRSRITMLESKKGFEVKIIADDLTALRASINSITRDMQVIEQASSQKF
jgi:tRNA threonylcarbamoyladenosine modification (KEOPS) complex  Pcc1 subunit